VITLLVAIVQGIQFFPKKKSLIAVQNQWFPWKSVAAMESNGRFTRCYGNLMFTMEVNFCHGDLPFTMEYWWLLKSLVAMEVNGCYGKQTVGMRAFIYF
jgi:hypothetical protein